MKGEIFEETVPVFARHPTTEQWHQLGDGGTEGGFKAECHKDLLKIYFTIFCVFYSFYVKKFCGAKSKSKLKKSEFGQTHVSGVERK